jgi:hypothetical protein
MPAPPAASGIDPADLPAIISDAEVETAWARSGDPARFDALYLRRGFAAPPSPAPPSVRPWTSYANQPQRGASGTDLASALRDHLRERLPAFMLPQEVVLLDRLPRTPNGKIDRAALPRSERAAPRPTEGQRPRNELERTISSVFESLLGSSEMGVETNFFELGANSLLLVRASGQLEELLQRPVSLVDFFRFPSIRQLAQRLGDPAEPLRGGVSQGQDRAQARRDLIQRRAAERAKK